MILSLAFRNLSRQRRRTALLGAAVGFAVLTICLANGFTEGMDRAVQDNVTLAAGGHVLVSGYLRSPSGRIQSRMYDDGTMARTLAGEIAGLRSVSPLVSVSATVVFGSREQQLVVRGVDWDVNGLYATNLILLSGSFGEAARSRSIVLGARSARRFGLGLGDSVLARFATASGQQNVTEYRLAAVYDDSAAGGLVAAFVGFGDLRQDLNLQPGWSQSLAFFLEDASAADRSADRIHARLAAEGRPVGPRYGEGRARAVPDRAPGSVMLEVVPISELAGQAASVLGTIRWIGVAVFIVMLALSGAGMANTYRMVLLERTREIGTLRCIGFRRRHVLRMFASEAAAIAVLGSCAGLAASFPLGLAAGLFRFDTSGALALALMRGRLAFVPTLPSMAFTVAAVVVMSLLAVSGPARRAAALVPAEALRATA